MYTHLMISGYLIPVPHVPCILQIPALRDVKELALGGTHSMAVLNSGQLLVWGVNQNGLLGLGNKGDMHVRLPTLIKGLSCEQVSVPSLPYAPIMMQSIHCDTLR